MQNNIAKILQHPFCGNYYAMGPHFVCFHIAFVVGGESARQWATPRGSYLLADTFQLFLMKRNRPFCGEEKRFQRTMTRDEVALSLLDARNDERKATLRVTSNSSKHAYGLRGVMWALQLHFPTACTHYIRSASFATRSKNFCISLWTFLSSSDRSVTEFLLLINFSPQDFPSPPIRGAHL